MENKDSISFSFDASDVDLASILGVESTPPSYAVVVETAPKINKPKNLKYPNKKRSRRIWKKWARRFGRTKGEYLFIPKCVISTELTEDGFNTTITALSNE